MSVDDIPMGSKADKAAFRNGLNIKVQCRESDMSFVYFVKLLLVRSDRDRDWREDRNRENAEIQVGDAMAQREMLGCRRVTLKSNGRG